MLVSFMVFGRQRLTDSRSRVDFWPALSFQSLPIVKFCNPLVLITIQNAGGGYTPSSSLASLTPSSHRLFSYTYELPNLQPLCFDNVATVRGCVPLLLSAKAQGQAGISIGMQRRPEPRIILARRNTCVSERNYIFRSRIPGRRIRSARAGILDFHPSRYSK